jgi:hypothetical protein
VCSVWGPAKHVGLPVCSVWGLAKRVGLPVCSVRGPAKHVGLLVLVFGVQENVLDCQYVLFGVLKVVCVDCCMVLLRENIRMVK